MPRRYSFVEYKVKAAVKDKIKRGKVDVSIMVENLTENDVTIKLNTMLAKQYYEKLEELQDAFDFSDSHSGISLKMLAGMPDVLKAIPDVEDEEEMTKCILEPVREAAADLETMRSIEGEKLAQDLI